MSESKGCEETNLALGGTGFVATAGISGCGLELCDIDNGVVLANSDSNSDTRAQPVPAHEWQPDPRAFHFPRALDQSPNRLSDRFPRVCANSWPSGLRIKEFPNYGRAFPLASSCSTADWMGRFTLRTCPAQNRRNRLHSFCTERNEGQSPQRNC